MTLHFRLSSVAVFTILAVSHHSAAVLASPPQITSVTGHSDGVGVSAGRWTGQPLKAPATASNQFKNFLASDSYNYGIVSANPYYWDINGKNFGISQGTVSVGPSPSPFTSISIVNWTGTSIRIKVVASRSYQSSSIILKVTTSTGSTSAPFSDKAVGIIKSRGCGQCTWFVAKTRLDQGLNVPPSAFSTTAAIPVVGAVDGGYRPARWDCLNYNGNHVAIITTTPSQTNNPDGSITFTFTVSECNATWNEAASSSSRSYKLSKVNATGKRTIQAGIGTNASATWIASGYYR